ncbi:cytochrome-c peroxidase [Celeribacter neptunius]|uniref:Cytochrome c peroxidase n=1 Tax=Celeribacter neptunius TaxID=588602 RepID=A0A1I3WB46_9RHOB|nr:cytochrome c peroxidase [Celeribacter neptunius]SFK04788.1 Cytochrome c peroxidase [Celeribacter neptunius]
MPVSMPVSTTARHLAPVLLSTAILAAPAARAEPLATLEALGEALFFDVNLSANRTESCASCHNPEAGFADPRGMASPGDDGVSVGDRNAPTASYAHLTPAFTEIAEGVFRGGQFLDGRASTLADQAGGPPLNPIEMGMPDAASVVARLEENPDYIAAFTSLFGDAIFSDTDAAYLAMTRAIEAFEQTDLFSPFDSKYDRYLRGEVELTRQEALGETLFFSQQFTNCNICHELNPRPGMAGETFSNYEYHNIGVPENTALREMNGAAGTVDRGLAQNPAVNDAPQTVGRFKVPTLRNVAVTGPYMHNGVFQDLRTVVLFYNTYNTKSEARMINPETGERFGAPEVAENVSMGELTEGPALEDREIDALVAFMKTLTDARYEHLLEE